jgi:general secretion pathway protein J
MTVRDCRRQKGFTLLELLISIALLSMIVLIIGGAMRMGFRSAESGQKRIESLERFRTSLNILESQLQSAFSTSRTGTQYQEEFSQFTGSRESMQFRSVYSLLGGARGPVEVSYVVRDDLDGKKTLFGSENLIVFTGQAKEIRLIDNASDIYFEYFDKGPTDEKGRWTYEWQEKDRMPEKVRLNIDNNGSLFSLIVPLRTGIGKSQAQPAGVRKSGL